MGVFERVAQMIAGAEAAAAAKTTVRAGVAVSDSDGHVQVQIGGQIWTVTDYTGRVQTGDQVTVREQGNTAVVLDNLREAAQSAWDALPPAMVLPWGIAAAPTAGWWLMQGQAVDPALYPVVAAVWGNPLPDARDRFLLGASGSHGVRTTGGSSSIATDQLPAHDHPVLNSATNIVAAGTGIGEEVLGASTSRGWRTGTAGSGAAYWPRYLAVNWIVRMG